MIEISLFSASQPYLYIKSCKLTNRQQWQLKGKPREVKLPIRKRFICDGSVTIPDKFPPTRGFNFVNRFLSKMSKRHNKFKSVIFI